MNAAQKVCWKAAKLIERDGLKFGAATMSFALLECDEKKAPGYWLMRKVLNVRGLAEWSIAQTKEEVIDVLVAAACGEWE